MARGASYERALFAASVVVFARYAADMPHVSLMLLAATASFLAAAAIDFVSAVTDYCLLDAVFAAFLPPVFH